jgi:hypothetical protein
MNKENKEALQKLLKKAYEKGYKRGQEDEAIKWQKEIKKQREEIFKINQRIDIWNNFVVCEKCGVLVRKDKAYKDKNEIKLYYKDDDTLVGTIEYDNPKYYCQKCKPKKK